MAYAVMGLPFLRGWLVRRSPLPPPRFQAGQYGAITSGVRRLWAGAGEEEGEGAP